MKKRFTTFIRHLIKNIQKPEMRILPGQLAFYFVLTLIPLAALLGSIISITNIPIGVLEAGFAKHLPAAVNSILLQISTENNVSINLIVFFVSSLILASNGTHSMIIASNHIYKIPDKSYLNRRIKSLFMMLNLIILLIFIVIFLVFGDKIVNLICSFDTGEKIYGIFNTIYQILKYPLSLLLIYISIKILYTMAPDTNIKSKQVTYGAAFTSVTWVIATRVYSIYIDKFSHYNSFYGSISNLIVLLLWIYILAYVFVLGMTLNATRYNLDTSKEKIPNSKDIKEKSTN